MLALNASIEASRVGEHGRGFTVVANETRKLAEQSALSAEDITALIQQIQETSLQSVKSMDNVVNDVQIGRTVVQESSESFQRIIQSSQEIADQIQDISAASEQMAASSEEAAATISEIAKITKISFDQFQSISETSSAQLSDMEELAEQANALNRMSQTLREQIGKFAI
ncbi:methyl-accepting chemotaxis protein [Paenibacillus sp. GP183]|uniref:methyl-accepting chemotaxis protein n=1 Tax=Paenibacillus sp. GP183 TaxID=1882751 RepID=UPI000B83613B|nr:methyl-accepting chemotaxis protein [Paenibacillus sp. GP183]